MKITKLMKILFIILFTFTLNSHIYSSLYFPLKVGNKFIFHCYEYSTPGPSENYDYSCNITKDTIINNHKYYRVENYYPTTSYWFRIDSLTGSLYYLDTTNSCSFYFKDNLVDSLLMPLNGTSNSCNQIKVTSIQDVIRWNKQSTEKVFYKEGGTVWVTRTRIYNSFFGPIKREFTAYYSGISNVSRYTLKGCIIDSVMYGDTVLVNVKNTNNRMPREFTLYQNYPNPFNPATKIRFDIKKSESRSQNSEVTLKIFDIMGKEVATLVNERLQAGTYETTFDGSGLNSGVYFYRLTTDGYSETKRMLLIK